MVVTRYVVRAVLKVYSWWTFNWCGGQELGMDPAELRRKNLLQPEDFPLRTGIIGQDFVEGILDSGNYPYALEKTLEGIEYEKFKQEIQPKARAEGKYKGIGITMFTEGTAVGPYEGCKVMGVLPVKFSVITAYSNQGQAHYTTFAQVAADQLVSKWPMWMFVTGDSRSMELGCRCSCQPGYYPGRNCVITHPWKFVKSIKPGQ